MGRADKTRTGPLGPRAAAGGFAERAPAADRAALPEPGPIDGRPAPWKEMIAAMQGGRRIVAQRQRLKAIFGRHVQLQPAPAAPGRVVQRLMTVAAFQGLTPGSFTRPRKSILGIDRALTAVVQAAPHAQVGPLDTLVDVITRYITEKVQAGDAANDRIPHARTLLNEAFQERPHALTRSRIHKLQNAPNGAIAAVAGDFAAPPLAATTPEELGAILAVGHIGTVADLSALLTATTSAVGAGSAALRLERVLRETAPPHTPLALAAPIAGKLEIDHKILRARLPNPLGAGVAPGAGHRDVIGGHSRRILSMPETFAVSARPGNANATVAASYRKVARGDAAGTAAAVANNVAGNIVQAFQARVQVGVNWINAPPAFAAGFLNAPPAVRAAANVQHATALAQAQAARGLFNAHVAAVQVEAAKIVLLANPEHATLLAAFVDKVEDARASATAVLTAVSTLLATPGVVVTAPQRQLVNQARQGVAADFAAFETAGPVLTNSKDSTLAPAGMSEDRMLLLGDQVAAVPATLLRHHPSNNNPAHGDQVSTKHQRVVGGILWIAMKDNVTYSNVAGVVTLNGGAVSSFYPTQHAAVPPDPLPPLVDADGFTAVH